MARRATKTVEPANTNVKIERTPKLRYALREVSVQFDSEGDLAFYRDWESPDAPSFVIDKADAKAFVAALGELIA